MLATETEAAAPVALITAELAMPLSVPLETMDASFLTRPVLVAVWTIGLPMTRPVFSGRVPGGPLRMLVSAMLVAAPVALARTEAPVPEMLPTEMGLLRARLLTVPELVAVWKTEPIPTIVQEVVLMNEAPTEAAAPVAVVETDDPWPARLPVVRPVMLLVTSNGGPGELVTVWLMPPRNGLVNVVVLIALTDTDACAPVADSAATAPFARLPLPSVISPTLLIPPVLMTCWNMFGGRNQEGPRERCIADVPDAGPRERSAAADGADDGRAAERRSGRSSRCW